MQLLKGFMPPSFLLVCLLHDSDFIAFLHVALHKMLDSSSDQESQVILCHPLNSVNDSDFVVVLHVSLHKMPDSRQFQARISSHKVSATIRNRTTPLSRTLHRHTSKTLYLTAPTRNYSWRRPPVPPPRKRNQPTPMAIRRRCLICSAISRNTRRLDRMRTS